MYSSLHFTAEMNTTGSRTTFVPFHTNFDYNGRLSIIKDLFLRGSLHNNIL